MIWVPIIVVIFTRKLTGGQLYQLVDETFQVIAPAQGVVFWCYIISEAKRLSDTLNRVSLLLKANLSISSPGAGHESARMAKVNEMNNPFIIRSLSTKYKIVQLHVSMEESNFKKIL